MAAAMNEDEIFDAGNPEHVKEVEEFVSTLTSRSLKAGARGAIVAIAAMNDVAQGNMLADLKEIVRERQMSWEEACQTMGLTVEEAEKCVGSRCRREEEAVSVLMSVLGNTYGEAISAVDGWVELTTQMERIAWFQKLLRRKPLG